MIDVERVNETCKKRYEKNKTEQNIEKYVMSELLSPLEDYYRALRIIDENRERITSLRLFYVAADLSIDWMPGERKWIDSLTKKINEVNNQDKAMIYYLEARYHYRKCGKESKEYRDFLEKSVHYSQGFPFVNNRYHLALISCGQEAIRLLHEAIDNVIIIETEDSLKQKPMDFWLSAQRWIDEFIVGTHRSYVTYETMIEKLKTYLR